MATNDTVLGPAGSIRTIAAARPALATTREGHLKVRLSYLTANPKHIRNIMLRNGYGIQGPYNEDVCILLPADKVFNDFESYLDAFETLKLSGVLHYHDTLAASTILVEDELTQAYILS